MYKRQEGKYIVVHCCPDEIEKYHLPDLNRDVTNSNDKYKAFVGQENLKRDSEVQKNSKREQDLNKTLDNLQF